MKYLGIGLLVVVLSVMLATVVLWQPPTAVGVIRPIRTAPPQATLVPEWPTCDEPGCTAITPMPTYPPCDEGCDRTPAYPTP